MEITDVSTLKTTVDISTVIKISFKILGAEPMCFEFPFGNESLTESKLEFIKEELDAD